MRFDYATSDENKIEAAKGVIRSRASVAKQEIAGFIVRQRSDYPGASPDAITSAAQVMLAFLADESDA